MNTQNFTCAQCGYSISDEFCVLSKLTQKKYYGPELMENAEGVHSDWLPICFYCFNGMERTEEESRHDETKDLSEDTLENENDETPSENIRQEKSNTTISKLISCPDCGKGVSRRAVSCPNCGCPISVVTAQIPKTIEPKTIEPETMEPGVGEILGGYSLNENIICPHCQKRGGVITKLSKKKKGISGGKATAAIFTLGWSLLATGLSRKEKVTEARCKKCGAKWSF